MTSLKWKTPIRFRDLVGLLLETPRRDSAWPPDRPGVYVITSQTWQRKCALGTVLYTGASGNLRHRIGYLTRDLLGFFGDSFGTHSGAQSLWNHCHKHRLPVGDLFVSWATTSETCHWCTEKQVAAQMNPSMNKRRGKSTCLCRIPLKRSPSK